jgi:hypothetical protein
MANLDLGKVKITFEGDFDNSKTYEELSIVNDSKGVKYISKKTVPTNTSLNNTEYWELLNGEFSGIYLGNLSSTPTTRNDGTSLQVGDMYFDTNANKMKVYGSNDSWQDVSSGIEDLVVNSVMSKAEFEALAEQRRQYFGGSGFIEKGIGESIDGLEIYDTIYSYENSFGIGFNGDGDNKNVPRLNVNGYNIKLYSRYANRTFNQIFLSSENIEVPIITDSTNAPAMKQGDFAILKDLDRNIGTNKISGVIYNGDDANGYIQSKETPIIALQDTEAGDIYSNTSYFEARDSVSRQDLVFLETWHEDIAEKDIVYPYGNVQYRGGDVDGLSGIANGNFTGSDTYSLFGNWQNAVDLVGKGYKWSNLTEEQRIKLASNPDNNIYKDGDKWVQVRYRIRVVRGLGSNWREK